MRLSKEYSAWFKVPDDQDGAEFEFRILTPSERAAVVDAAMDMTIDFDGEKPAPKGRPTTQKGREKEIVLSTKSWKKVFDEDGTELKDFTDKNKLKIFNKVPGFYEYFSESYRALEKAFGESRKAQEKN